MRNRDYDAMRFWEACVLAGLASGRATVAEATTRADQCVEERLKRWPQEARPQEGE